MPAPIPVTTPEAAFTVSIAVAVVLHVPPEMASVSVVVLPVQVVRVPLIVGDPVVTVTAFVVLHDE